MHILRQAVLLYGVTLEVIEAASRMLNCSEGELHQAKHEWQQKQAACQPKLEPNHISLFLQPVQVHNPMPQAGVCDTACPSCCRLMFDHRKQPFCIKAAVGNFTGISSAKCK